MTLDALFINISTQYTRYSRDWSVNTVTEFYNWISMYKYVSVYSLVLF